MVLFTLGFLLSRLLRSRRLLISLPFCQFLEQTQVQWHTITHPCSSLCMVSLLFFMLAGDRINTVRVDQHAQRATVNNKPRDESTELGGCEQVYFKHRNGMWSNWHFPKFVDAQFWDCEVLGDATRLNLIVLKMEGKGEHTFTADSLPKFTSEFQLLCVGLEIIDMYITVKTNISHNSGGRRNMYHFTYKPPLRPVSNGAVKAS